MGRATNSPLPNPLSVKGCKPWDAVAGIALLVMALALNQFITLDKFAALPPGAGFLTIEEFADRVSESVSFDGIDGLIAVLMLASGLYLLWCQIRRDSLGRLVEILLSNERRALWSMLFVNLVFVRYYFAFGQMSWAGDSSEHLAYAVVASKSLASGEWPIWTNSFSAGSPYGQFYGFLFFIVVGLVDQLFGDIHNSLKVVMGSMHALSGLSVYGVARMQGLRRGEACLAGWAYVLSVWHMQQVMSMGRYPLSIVYALLPLPLLFFERARLMRRQVESAFFGGLALAAIAFTHPGYGYWAALFTGVYVAVRSGWWKGKRQQKWFFWGVILLAYGLLVGSYLTLPMHVEKEYTGLSGGVSLDGVPDPTWEHVLVWSNFRIRLSELMGVNHHWYGGYIGLSLCILALVAVVGWWRSRSRSLGAILVCGFVAWSLVFAYRSLLVQQIPFASSFNAGRYLLFFIFFLSLAAGWGAHLWRRSAMPLSLLPMLLVGMDLLPATFQHPYAMRSASLSIYPSVKELGLVAEDGQLLTEGRLFPTTANMHPFIALSWFYTQTGLPTMGAIYTESPRVQDRFFAPWSKAVTDMVDRRDESNPLFQYFKDGARLQNILYVIGIDIESEILKQYEIWPHTPVLASVELIRYPEEKLKAIRENGQLDQLIARYFPEGISGYPVADSFDALFITSGTGVHPTENTCRAIYVRGLPEDISLSGVPRVSVLEHREKNQYVFLRLQTSSTCFVRLAYAYYPFLEVRVNGRKVEPWETAGGFIALQIDGGESEIELIPRLSPLRRTLLGMVAFTVVLGGYFWRRERVQRSHYYPYA